MSNTTTVELTEDEKNIIKFIKSPEYQKLLKRYSDQALLIRRKLEKKYSLDNDYKANHPIYSELYLEAKRIKILRDRVKDIKWDSEWANLLRGKINKTIWNLETHLYNSVTGTVWMSKDTPSFTSDDVQKDEMLFWTDFHLLIIWLLDSWKKLTNSEKRSVYENPEEQEQI